MSKYLLFILYLFLVNTVSAQENTSGDRKIKSVEVLAVNDIPFSLAESEGGMLNVIFNQPVSKFVASLMNASGQLYYQSEKFSATGSLKIDVKNLTSGVYFLEIISGKKKSVRKIKI